MRRWGLIGAVLLAGALALALAAPAGAAVVPPDSTNLPWPDLLPPLPVSAKVQPHPVYGCRTPSLGCTNRAISRLDRLRRRWGCDHRGIFPVTYERLTQQAKTTLLANPHFFQDPHYFFFEDALFANYYFHWVRRMQQHQSVPDAWKIAFDTAQHGNANAGQDLLLDINAHVQRDMPFVMAALGLRMRSGRSRKHDHDIFNYVLQHAYEPIVEEIGQQFDPIMLTAAASWNPLDNIGALELVKVWREGVWRNAERLLNAKTPAARSSVANTIEIDAAVWARFIAAQGVAIPGYRATRDTYCRAHRKA